MSRTLFLCGALLLNLLAANAQAISYAGNTFEIEMIVFIRAQGMEQARETWPATPHLEYSNNWVDFDTVNGDVQTLVPAMTRLDNKADALRRDKNYQVLFHKAWRQVLQEKRNAPAVLISGGESFRGHQQLEGSITLSVSRYLHLSTDLWFNEFGSGEADGVQVPKRPKPMSSEPMGLLGGTTSPADVQTIISAEPFYAQRVAVLQEERRLRSGELHYIDHPKLGVLFEVRSVDQKDSSDQ